MSGRQRPGWSEPVPSTAQRARYVACAACGRGLSWQDFVRHLRYCQAESTLTQSTGG